MFTTSATAGLIPTNDGLTCVFVGTAPERFARGETDLYDNLLREANPTIAERVLSGSQVGVTRRFTARPGRMLRPHGPGWALVGDAGYWKDPITAHGLTDALRDAELLARATLAAFDGDTFDDALTWYHRERNRLSRELFDITDRIARAEWTDDEIGTLLRALSRSMSAEVETLTQLGPWPPPTRSDGRPSALATTAP
jgi:flavin-dependent dehydrogenase